MKRPDDWELIAFFEQEPIEIDREDAEFFGSVSFRCDLGGGDVLLCDIGDSFGDLVFTLSRNGVEQIVLRADDVASVKLERPHGVETLVALFGTRPTSAKSDSRCARHCASSGARGSRANAFHAQTTGRRARCATDKEGAAITTGRNTINRQMSASF